MKETGIIMSGDHPRKILDGTKTMTRRTAGLGKVNEKPADWSLSGRDIFHYWLGQTAFIFHHKKTGEEQIIKCPYGQVGDRLWVRETWALNFYNQRGGVIYRADYNALDHKINWKPSIHMFKKDARIWLEITEVRVERVQEITSLDAVYEGCPKYHEYNGKMECIKTISPIDRFHLLWDSLNAKRKPTKYDKEHGITKPITPAFDWMANPWVWVLSFKLVSQ